MGERMYFCERARGNVAPTFMSGGYVGTVRTFGRLLESEGIPGGDISHVDAT